MSDIWQAMPFAGGDRYHATAEDRDGEPGYSFTPVDGGEAQWLPADQFETTHYLEGEPPSVDAP
ncbi:hypothetical protein BH10PSE14_BH10PSE14_06900 [soil metagenome]